MKGVFKGASKLSLFGVWLIATAAAWAASKEMSMVEVVMYAIGTICFVVGFIGKEVE